MMINMRLTQQNLSFNIRINKVNQSLGIVKI